MSMAAAKMSSPRPVSIVAIGGGTGLPVLLAGLRRLARGEVGDSPLGALDVSAIVSVADNGGSSGRLRTSLHLPAVGDLRNCVSALSDAQPISGLFQHRFLSDDALHGHSLGNLMLAALCQRSGSLTRAADDARALLGGRGTVLPVTERAVDLCAQFEDGQIARGEIDIATVGKSIHRVWLEPADPDQPAGPAPGVIEAIARANVLVLGPGSLHTSIVPNLAVAGVADAIRETMALRVLVCNLMTQPGETDGYSVTDHIRVIEHYIGERVLDVCIIHDSEGHPHRGDARVVEGSEPVAFDPAAITARHVVPLIADVAGSGGDKVRHDPIKLAGVIAALAARVFPPPAMSGTHLQSVK